MLMVHHDEPAVARLSQEEFERVPREHAAFSAELKAAGVYVAGDRLRPSREARRYRQEKGKRTLIDGPHPETREVIGGYYLIECPSEEAARAWAEKCPMWDCDVMELRPVWPEETRSCGRS
jgi:hypothetical protein